MHCRGGSADREVRDVVLTNKTLTLSALVG